MNEASLKPGKSLVKILIADDHLLFTEGLSNILAEKFSIVCKTSSGKEVLPLCFKHNPDILLLDFNLPDLSGLEVARLLQVNLPKVKILVLTMYDEKRFVEKFRQTGVRAYLPKSAHKDELIFAIEKIHSGGEYFEIEKREKEGLNHSDDFFLKTFSLTSREIEIIKLIKDGLNNREIAGQLHLSFYTIDTHRKNIHVKLGITKAAELIRFAVEFGL